MRKDPPISTSSPLETITSFPEHSPASIRRTAPALLFTTIPASAPVISLRIHSTWSLLCPRLPSERSYSRVLYLSAAARTALPASGARHDLPRFVWITTPVAFITGLRLPPDLAARTGRASFRTDSAEGSTSSPASIFFRRESMASPRTVFTASLPRFSRKGSMSGMPRRQSMAGSDRSLFFSAV